VKFTGPGDRIEVTGELSAHEWRVRVRDTGSGMSSETAEHLLTRPPGRGTGTGSGLGLAIVRAVVESLGGEIMVSGEPNRGTTVTLRIPRPQRMTVDQARATDPVITEPAAAPGG
ncbi:MAG: two-component system, OmpR family, sensor histidine kinase BaeS, partial [Micromonosporaceae bacterium]|nr:two-component system, OmpR family, sensor histidine kinase BaeS [Micromonosporaceae bacterium]